VKTEEKGREGERRGRDRVGEIERKKRGKGNRTWDFLRDKGEKAKAYVRKRRTETGGHCTEEKRNRTERGKEKTGGETEGGRGGGQKRRKKRRDRGEKEKITEKNRGGAEERNRGDRREGKKTVAAYTTTPATSSRQRRHRSR